MYKTLAVFIIAVVVIIISCGGNSTSYHEEDFVYPMSVGNKWEYSGEMAVINIIPEGSYPGPDTVLFNSTVEIVEIDTLQDTLETYLFQETLVQDIDTFYSDKYFNNTDDGMYIYAHDRGSGIETIPWKAGEGYSYVFMGRRFNNVREIFEFHKSSFKLAKVFNDSITYENPPLKSLQYPLKENAQWNFRETGNPWRMDKKITDWTTISVPAGGFDCFEIKVMYDTDEDGQWDQNIEILNYISEIGLISRITNVKGVIVTYGTGNTTGVVDIQEKYVLTAYQVQ